MKKLLMLFCGLCWAVNSAALSGQEYMDRYTAFRSWYQNIPIVPSAEFLAFVKESTPLANKLRDKWLYELARTKNWATYEAYYQPTNDINLRCYALIGKLTLGKEQEVLNSIAPIWLTGESQAPACDKLFDAVLKSDGFDQDLITQRIVLALEKHNIHLARYLLKHYKTPRVAEAETISAIHQKPLLISTLKPGGLHGLFYLYGLKRLMAVNMDQAISLWQQGKNKKVLNEAEQHAFLAHLAFYKAMRNHPDASTWFNKIKPLYYNETLIDWQIRFALKNKNWSKVIMLINKASNKDSPCWQYWLARAYEQQGKKAEAQAVYEPLAKSRQYYGFLASMRLNKKPSFDNEKPVTDTKTLHAYTPFIKQIKSLYTSGQSTEASRLLNDFISELDKHDASALIYWVDSELEWHGKSLYLSNNDILTNQLALRFPLAYKNSVTHYAKQHAVAPELVYAIIRQESGFRADVVSPAGARGLMQVMPGTAKLVAKQVKIPYTDPNQLFLSQKNINIGIAYLQHLMRRFGNHPILVAAAYNAGPSQVGFWLRNHPPKEIDVWIETLPWQETRNYLKNVMAFSVVYQYRLNQKPNFKHFMAPL